MVEIKQEGISKEEKEAPAKEVDYSLLSTAVLSLELKRVKSVIASFPSLRNAEGDVVIKQFEDNAKTFIVGLRQAIQLCVDENEKHPEKWRIALHILQSFIPEYPIFLTAYIKLEKIDPSESYQHLAYDKIPLEISHQNRLMPLESLARSALIFYEPDLNDPDILNDLCFLMQTFRSMGWGRSFVLDDHPAKALKDFKKYLQKFSPDLEAALKKIPSKTLDSVLSQLINAFKAGKAEDDLYLSTGKQLEEDLIDYKFPTPVAQIICEYVGFFGHRSAQARKKQAELLVSEKSSTFDQMVASVKSWFGNSRP